MTISNFNKALILMTAIGAFAVGALVHHSHTYDVNSVDTHVLLNAQLLDSHNTQSLKQVNQYTEKLTLINFWASWCAPCRDEMPLFEAMYQIHNKDGFQIIGIAIDSPEKAQPMLDSMGISYPILYAETAGMDLMSSSGNPQGLLPYSILIDQQGNAVEQVLGKIDETKIANWIQKHL